RETARLEILRDLEAGRIDVSAATARLAELDGGSAAGRAAASTGPTASGGGSSTTAAHDSWAVHFWDHRA
ncbi:MAG TPA: hypothetical protein VEG29_01910, partial [Candidatus Binatia bacterium]|nr:hypothetical protein [Candidatus Binatia bacterium]